MTKNKRQKEKQNKAQDVAHSRTPSVYINAIFGQLQLSDNNKYNSNKHLSCVATVRGPQVNLRPRRKKRKSTIPKVVECALFLVWLHRSQAKATAKGTATFAAATEANTLLENLLICWQFLLLLLFCLLFAVLLLARNTFWQSAKNQ